MQEFAFSAPAQTQMLNYIIIGVVAVVGVIGIAFGESKSKRILTAVVIIPVLFFLGRFMLPTKGGSKVTLGETLTVQSSYGKMDVARGDIVSTVVVGDLGADPNLSTVMKTNGAAIGQYKLGWFLLKNGKKAFIMTATPEVVALELKDKYVILAPKDFDQFVKALNDWYVPVK